MSAKVCLKDLTSDERREYLREIGRRGGKARAQQFTSASQRAARSKVASESCRRNGSKGARRTIELHGFKALFEGARRRRLVKPSPCELVMIGLLKTLGFKYQREKWLGDTLYTLDFYLPGPKVAIEVDGAIHDPGKPGHAEREHHAEQKATICSALGIALIRIHHSELGENLSGAIAKIQEIAGSGNGPAGKTAKNG